MLTHNSLKKGVKIIIHGEPYEILESNSLKKAQRRVVIQTKIKNLINGNVVSKNFHQSDTVQEAELIRAEAKFLYSHHGQYFFCEKDNPAKRFNLSETQIGFQANFLKQNQIVIMIVFKDKIINVSLPIKIQLKVIESPPGIKGDRSHSGTKIVILETKAKLNTPLFIKEGDIIEINTETGEYVRRIT